MISFEEFKTEYKEMIDLQIAIAGSDPVKSYQLIVQFDTPDNNNEDQHKRSLFAANSWSTDFPTTFNINDTNIGVYISIKNDKGVELIGRLRVEVIEILSEKNFTFCKDLKVDGLYLYARINLPENTYPMYTLAIAGINLPLLSGLFGECDPFMRILKKNPNFGTYSMVHESEVHRNTSNPVFKPVKLSLQRLCGGIPF